MNRARSLFIALALGGLASMGGCLAFGGSDRTYVHKPTVGQELIDLQSAHQSGAISQAEYDRLRTEITARPSRGGD